MDDDAEASDEAHGGHAQGDDDDNDDEGNGPADRRGSPGNAESEADNAGDDGLLDHAGGAAGVSSSHLSPFAMPLVSM